MRTAHYNGDRPIAFLRRWLRSCVFPGTRFRWRRLPHPAPQCAIAEVVRIRDGRLWRPLLWRTTPGESTHRGPPPESGPIRPSRKQNRQNRNRSFNSAKSTPSPAACAATATASFSICAMEIASEGIEGIFKQGAPSASLRFLLPTDAKELPVCCRSQLRTASLAATRPSNQSSHRAA